MRCAARLLAEVGRRAYEQRAAVVAAEHAGEDVQASGAGISSTISPPGARRTQRAPTSSAAQMCPSASRAQPSGPNRSWPSVSASVVSSGVGATCAQTRRSVRAPSSPTVNAV